jgi:hypothetical protein
MNRGAIVLFVIGFLMYSSWLVLSGSSPLTGLKLARGLETVETGIAPGEGSSIGYLFLGLDVILVSSIFWLSAARPTASWWTFLLRATAICSAFALFGFRYRLLIVGLAAMVIWYRHATRTLKLRHLVGLVCVSILVSFGVGIYRAPQGSIRTARADQVALGTFDLSAALAVVVDQVPSELPFLDGSSYWPIVTQWIPSSLWPDKPRSGTVEAIDSLTDAGAGMAVPLWGEFYLNFGFPGVLVGMAMSGAIGAGLDRRLDQAVDPARVAIMALALGFWLHVFSRGNMINQISLGAVMFGVPMLYIRWSARRTSRRKSGQQAPEKVMT